MRKLITCTMLLLLTTVSFCQQTENRSFTRQEYLDKSKKQKTAAWVMLGAGTAVAVGGAILDVSSDWTKSETPYLVAIAAGGASMLGSIPLFIASGRNKRKAINASTWLEIRKQPFPINNGLALHTAPTLSLRLNF